MQGRPPLLRRRLRRPLAGESPEPATAGNGAARPRREYGFGLPATGGPLGEGGEPELPVRGERGGSGGGEGRGEAGEGALRGGGGVMEAAGLGARRCRRRHGVGRSDGLRAACRLHPQPGLQVTFSL